MLYKFLAALALLAVDVYGDCYMHYPRGSNNRLNEASANRNNANRLFDSQNNNRGGYNVGDMDPENGFTENTYMATFTEMYDFRRLNDAGDLQKQYEMLFFEESKISVTWTNQHGAGNQKLNSMFVLQFICDTFERASSAGQSGCGPTCDVGTEFTGPGAMNGKPSATDAERMRKHGLRVELYNGGNTNTPTEPNFDANSIQNAYDSSNGNRNGRRESEEYYAYCKARSANYGLFHADQQLQGYTQKYTRQNPGGTRRGLECPEERDYYPWWNPSPFHDIAIITDDKDYCESTIAPNSQNVVEKYQCVVTNPANDQINSWIPSDDAIAYNLDEDMCNQESGHSWEGFRWYGDEPECVEGFWSKVNYLGSVDGTKRGGKMAHYDWQLPSFQELTEGHMCWEYTQSIDSVTTSEEDDNDGSVQLSCVRMMFRIRYNMSSMDYDPYATNSSMDEDDNEGIISPIENNPTVDVGVYAQGLRLAINTAQTGRVFQDNSHTFLVCERPSAFDDDRILNVGVRGKRGNIVQTFPAIEYDFEPKHIFVDEGDCLHFQWTGSNTHNNGAPGGDGQTGDAGEGRGGSDRSTLVQTLSLDESYPLTYDKTHEDVDKFFEQVTCRHPLFPSTTLEDGDAELILGTAGFYRSVNDATSWIASQNDQSAFVDVLLNNASASFRQGLLCCVDNGAERGDYNFISTRNNNFTNRSQKLKIVITNDKEPEDQW